MNNIHFLPFKEIPQEIHEAADRLSNYFAMQGAEGWEFKGVADRNQLIKLQNGLFKSEVLVHKNRELKALHDYCSILEKELKEHQEGDTFRYTQFGQAVCEYIEKMEGDMARRRFSAEDMDAAMKPNVELCQPCPPSTPPRQETAAGQGLA